MQTFACKLNLIALALGAALTAPGCATDWFSSSSSDYVAGELSQDVENLPDPNAPPAPPKRSPIVSPLGASFKESPDRLLLQANAYFEQGKFHDSARLYQKYLATPEAAAAPPTVLGQAHYRVAVVARKKMNFAEAKREFEAALRYEPQNQQYRFDLGKSAFDGADYTTADAAFSALIAQNPNYPQVQYYYGLTLLEGTRRAEALVPLTQAVGELEAATLLTDKYYAVGDAANAASWEAQTTQIAARLGRPVPTFPNKPAFASTVQPQAPAQVAPTLVAQAPQPQATVQNAPTAQPQETAQIAQVAPTTQPQKTAQTAQVAPTTQPQETAQAAPASPPQETSQSAATLVAQAPQPQETAQIATTAQPQETAQIATTAQPQETAQIATTAQPQETAQNAPTLVAQAPTQSAPVAQLQGPAPFVAASEPTFAEVVSSVEPLENSAAEAVEAQPLAVASPNEPTAQNAQIAVAETPNAETSPPSAPSVGQDKEETQTLTACVGRRNPGLFAAPSPVDSATSAFVGFRPGSISSTAPAPKTTQSAPVAQTTQDAQIAQNAPVVQTTQDAPTAQNAPSAQTTQDAQIATSVGPQLPKQPRFDAETAFRRVERFVELEKNVAEFFAPLAPIYETAPSPFQAAQPDELYAVAPLPSDLATDADEEAEEFDENEDFAFASSGAAPSPQPEPSVAAIGGFGSYQAPTFDATPASAVPSTTQIPFAAQNAYPAPVPQVAQAAPTTQIPFAAQNAYPAPVPQVAQTAPTTVSQYAAPTASRRPATPEERLQAAIAAGAEVREISPEEYRRAVQVGMSGQAQPR